MFASLKSKIKEETGSDLSRLTSSWRTGAFLGRIGMRDDSSTTSPSSSGEQADTTSDSISPQLHSYLSERTGGKVDQTELQQQYASQLEDKLRDRDAYWEQKIEQLKLSLASVQGEEAMAAQMVARNAQAEASKAISERDTAVKQLNELHSRLVASENAQVRLDAITEELEQARREWSRERAQTTAALGAAEARARDLADELVVLRAALPADNPHHHMNDDDKREVKATGCAELDRVCRERAVLARQLQEAKMALADVKTSWSGQIASLETQVARLSRQAGEEGAERRRVETEKRELQDKLDALTVELEKVKQNLANSEAKVVRLNGEVHSLAMEAKALRGSRDHAAEHTMSLESRVEQLTAENRELLEALENERTIARALRAEAAEAARAHDDRKAELNHLNSLLTEMQHDCIDLQRKFDKEKREKDEALLRNAHMSQSIELSRCNERHLEGEAGELRAKIAELEAVVAQHRENQAACMLIKEGEEARARELEEARRRERDAAAREAARAQAARDLEADLCDKNKKIKTLENRISDMKKTLQRELQSSKSDLTSAEEQEISRRYLKHVVLRFLTARELEARQLTRALATLLRLSAHEEALLRAALPPRSGLAAWLPSLNT